MTAALRVGVAGLGLVGGSILQGLAAAGAGVAGFDVDAAAAGAAARAGVTIADDVESLARSSDVVIVCVPPSATSPVVVAALAADPHVVVADACSVKAPVVRAVVEAAGDDARRFVAAHPLAGAEVSGWGAADPALLRDAVWAVCPPGPGAPIEPLCTLSAALAPLGARLVACTPEDHDDAVARTSHVPHLVAQALARLPAGEPLAAALSGGAFRDMTRIAAADEALWRSILLANREAALPALAALRENLERLAVALETGDDAVLAAAWKEGSAERARVEALRWTEPAWHDRTVSGWDELLELGRAGVAVRRVRAARDGGLELEAAG